MTILWYNDNIKIDNIPVFFMNLYERGVKFISYLFDKNGIIYTIINMVLLCPLSVIMD